MIETSALNSPNENTAIDDLNALYAYVRAQRVKSGKYPAILPLIADFEGWYGGLEAAYRSRGPFGSITAHVIDQEDVAEAKRRRTAINELMGARLPADWTPADAGQTPPNKPDSTWLPYVAIAGAAIIAWLVIRS